MSNNKILIFGIILLITLVFDTRIIYSQTSGSGSGSGSGTSSSSSSDSSAECSACGMFEWWIWREHLYGYTETAARILILEECPSYDFKGAHHVCYELVATKFDAFWKNTTNCYKEGYCN